MKLTSTLLAFAASLALAAPAFAADDGPCTLKMKGDSPTAAACKKGGRGEAVKTMKAMVKKGKAAGVKFVCDDCHKDQDNYTLTDNAEKDYEKLLAANK